MESQTVRALLAGVFFGIWPLLMNRSGLSGNVSTAVFAGVIFVLVLPVIWFTGGPGNLEKANWIMAIAAGLTGGMGLLCFNGMLARATRRQWVRCSSS